MSISFEDWPEYCRTHNVRLVGVRWLDDGSLQAIVEPRDPPTAADGAAHTDPPQAGDGEQPPSGKARPRSSLARSPAAMESAARRTPGIQQHVDLPGGLRIDVLIAAEQPGNGQQPQVKLLLARRGVSPSETEWITVLNHWPYDPPLDLAPRRFEHNGWFCLTASWPLSNQQRQDGAEISNHQSGELPHVPETLRPQPARRAAPGPGRG